MAFKCISNLKTRVPQKSFHSGLWPYALQVIYKIIFATVCDRWKALIKHNFTDVIRKT